jgi:hypothetical protein
LLLAARGNFGFGFGGALLPVGSVGSELLHLGGGSAH